MNKWSGLIGFVTYEDDGSGNFMPKNIERSYKGDVVKLTRRLQTTDQKFDKIVMNNRLSIICDVFMNENIYNIKYATFKGAKWTVTDIDMQYPRIIITLGELYNA